ncbi:competence protein ComK [Salirhabdus salicampi]|uniref:competence protein ComK n=1 Tax=Salirhabdus salicampi TaxID=476102 RepID=UPI0020C42FF4|nr:competence protein ComK [Salirhabdus salicampi]MCP8615532.1 competence protein ComK [Salirhabdus salicampi]
MENIKNYYEISPLTLTILPKWLENGVAGSLVLEQREKYVVNIPPRTLIDQACKFFGSSLRGRQEGTKDIAGITHKSPIAIDPHSGMYFFPTSSPVKPSCSWIAHSHIENVQEMEHNQSKITFVSGQSVVYPISYGSMMNQVHRTAQFRYKFTERLQNHWNSENDLVAERLQTTYNPLAKSPQMDPRF